MSEEILVNYDEFSKAITSISNIVSSFESIQSNINNGPQSMSPGNYGLGMNMNSQNFDLNSNLHHDEIDNDEEEGSSGDEEEDGRKF